jgi:hypothetical protein
MTSFLPCTCSTTCQVDRACQLPPRFQAQIDVPPRAQRPRVRRRAAACAGHFGALVTAISGWAHDQDLAGADLTVLAVDLPPGTRPPGRYSHHNVTRTQGLVISTIHMGTPHSGGSSPSGDRYATPDLSQGR